MGGRQAGTTMAARLADRGKRPPGKPKGRVNWACDSLPPADKQKLREALAAECSPCPTCGTNNEYVIKGYAAIAAWLVRFGLDAKPRSSATIRRRIRRLGLPTYKQARQGYLRLTEPITSNLLMHAWLGTQARLLGLPPWHPQRTDGSLGAVYPRTPPDSRPRRPRPVAPVDLGGPILGSS